MIKLKTIQNFTLQDYKKLSNIEIHNLNEHKENELLIDDVFCCDEEMAKYLTGNNPINKVVAEVIEVIPEVKEEFENVVKEEFKKTRKKKSE